MIDEQPARIRFPKTDLPEGARKVVMMGRREIAVFNVGGRLYAIFNRCPHHQAPLHTGPIYGTSMPGAVGEYKYGLEGRVLRCPWHHYEYDLDTGRCLADPERLRVKTYRIREEGEDIAVYS
jgi:3-phenylpropionate/trans-cinnamate dioxygenase ferredoxin subunit